MVWSPSQRERTPEVRARAPPRGAPFTGRPNAFASLTPFLFEGTLTRTVEDAALGLQVMAGPDPRDPFALTDTPDFAAALTRPVKGWRIAYSPNFDVYPVE